MPALIFLSIFFGSQFAHGRIYDLYRSDRRFKGAFCTAIGGACAADNDIVTGIFENPAALATGESDWDFDGDYSAKSNLEPGMKSSTDLTETSGVIGVSYTNGKVGAGMAFARQIDSADTNLTLFDDAGLPKTVKVSNHATYMQIRAPLAYQLSEALSVGAGLSLSSHGQEYSIASSAQQPDSDSSRLTLGLSLGALYSYSPRLRFGTWIWFPTTLYETVNLSVTSLATTVNYREDMALYYPWVWAIGAQITNGDSNLLFAELDVIGASSNAYLLSYDTLSAALNDSALTPKGRHLVVEPHMGSRWRIGGDGTRIHAGAYYETSRWEGLPGRLHGTGGVSFEAFHIAEVIGGIDVAQKYQQLIFTFR
ncbi:MAG: hypothetical protein ACXVB9_10980 [Bdellovibrionota bacterium]